MPRKPIDVEALKHMGASRRNIPTAELESVMRMEDKSPVRIAYERRIPRDANGASATRNRDLDPQLVWRGKDEQDWSDLVVAAPPLYIQEKVHPKVIIDDLKRQSKAWAKEKADPAPDLFADFNGLKDREAATEFYAYDQHWSNRMILGDSLSVMASLAEREGLRGKVLCIYFDPPYGIKFNSNFQWSTTSRDVKDGAKDHITREPEQVRAFRDTWRDGIHSYLTYLRDRLTVARDLLTESGSIFVQIGDENVHRVRSLMDEVFGDENFVVTIYFRKTTTQSGDFLADTNDYIVWYARDATSAKFRAIQQEREGYDWVNYDYVMSDDLRARRIEKSEKDGSSNLLVSDRVYRRSPLTSASASQSTLVPFEFQGQTFKPGKGGWKTNPVGIRRLIRSYRVETYGSTAAFRRYTSDFPYFPISNSWTDTASGGYGADKVYVVQTNVKVVERCLLMTTDPGDLVLDPTCGSGTTAYVAEQWGRRWITIDTSRVSLALARSRIMGARYPYYLLADSSEGQRKEAEVTRSAPKTTPTHGDIRQGFVYERVPHIMLSDIAKNAEIDVIWERWQQVLEPLRLKLNALLSSAPGSARGSPQAPKDARIKSGHDENGAGDAPLHEWQIPREASPAWDPAAKEAHAKWWEARIARQREIDASIAAKAEFEYLYDKPYPDNSKVRVAGPFTVESLSPHRTLAVDHDDELIDLMEAGEGRRKKATGDGAVTDFAQMILENLKAAGVQQAHKEGRINFQSLVGWPGELICAEGRYMEGEKERRAGIFVGPEFGTVSRPDLVAAAREAGDAGFDVLIACAFNYDAHSAEFDRLGRVPVLRARMNPDLHMGGDLKATGAGNLFVIFGEPDIRILKEGNEVRVKIEGVDVFKPQTGEVISEGPEGIALWMIDSDYNEESFFVRHAYFLGANDPYKALKTTLKAEIDQEAWESLNSDVSRPFGKPKSGRIAVKVINHLGDEVMKVFEVR